MSRRKPPWLRILCPDTCNTAHLVPRRCGGCREWTAVYTGGNVEEVYDPGILTFGRDITTALLLERRLTRIVLIGDSGLFHLQDVCGARGIQTDGWYLAEHVCHTTPVSNKPFRLPRRPRERPWGDDIAFTEKETKEFERIWRQPSWA